MRAKDLGIDFVHKEKTNLMRRRRNITLTCCQQNGPFSAVEDVNGDGLEDLFIELSYPKWSIL
jgi:hypothetical protein